MKTSTFKQRSSLLGSGLFTLLFFMFAWSTVSGQPYPKVYYQPDLLKSTLENKPLIDSTLEELYNTSTEQWERSRVIRYTYTSFGQKSQIFYDDVNDVDDFKYDYTYDTAEIMIFYLRSIWDTGTNQWMHNQKNEITLDTSGNVFRRIGYCWDDIDNSWQNLQMYEYAYDASGKVLQVFLRFWDKSKSQWRDCDKTEYTRDGNGNITYYIWQHWNNSNSQWYDAFSMEYTYNAEGREIHFIQYRRDTIAGQWINHYKQDNTWSTEGYKLLEHEWRWDTTSGDWINYKITEYAYDINGVNSSEVGSIWVTDAGQWIFEYRKTNYYAGYSSAAMSEKGGAEIHLFPNPADEYVIIDIDRSSDNAWMEIYDIQGRKVLSRPLDDSKPMVPVSHLKNGIYLYIIYGIETYRGKMEIGR